MTEPIVNLAEEETLCPRDRCLLADQWTPGLKLVRLSELLCRHVSSLSHDLHRLDERRPSDAQLQARLDAALSRLPA